MLQFHFFRGIPKGSGSGHGSVLMRSALIETQIRAGVSFTSLSDRVTNSEVNYRLDKRVILLVSIVGTMKGR